MADALIAAGISCWYPAGEGRVHAVRRVNLRVAAAELVAVLGHSGAGTTTLLSVCGGVHRPDLGQVLIGGQQVNGLAGPDRDAFLQRMVAWVPQRPLLLPLLTAEENVAVVLRIAGEDEPEATRSARMALDAVGLRHRAGARAADLSTAERRRVALARGLVRAPVLLVADQPTAGLDASWTAVALGLLRDAAESGTAVLLATRDERVAAAADRVLLMESGALSELV